MARRKHKKKSHGKKRENPAYVVYPKAGGVIRHAHPSKVMLNKMRKKVKLLSLKAKEYESKGMPAIAKKALSLRDEAVSILTSGLKEKISAKKMADEARKLGAKVKYELVTEAERHAKGHSAMAKKKRKSKKKASGKKKSPKRKSKKRAKKAKSSKKRKSKKSKKAASPKKHRRKAKKSHSKKRRSKKAKKHSSKKKSRKSRKSRKAKRSKRSKGVTKLNLTKKSKALSVFKKIKKAKKGRTFAVALGGRGKAKKRVLKIKKMNPFMGGGKMKLSQYDSIVKKMTAGHTTMEAIGVVGGAALMPLVSAAAAKLKKMAPAAAPVLDQIPAPLLPLLAAVGSAMIPQVKDNALASELTKGLAAAALVNLVSDLVGKHVVPKIPGLSGTNFTPMAGVRYRPTLPGMDGVDIRPYGKSEFDLMQGLGARQPDFGYRPDQFAPNSDFGSASGSIPQGLSGIPQGLRGIPKGMGSDVADTGDGTDSEDADSMQ